ncbi:MAG: UvrD-helicase domain-containing protein [Bacteroidales bacterium]|nr:UvrD-helicase domain-containing protein [Bacteroidales bacterium]
MSFLSKIFSRKRKNSFALNETKEFLLLMEFLGGMEKLLSKDKYIARSDYYRAIEKYNQVVSFFDNLRDSDMLEAYCQKNCLDIQRIMIALDYYHEIGDLQGSPSFISKHNEDFLSSHLRTESAYLDNILKSVDPVIKLDDEQRKVVLSDEDYTLVIAGAGAGKTTTVAAKVKYLVERKGIRPEQILVISFTNKAVGELRDKINKSLKIKCPVTTFHKTGYAILRKQDNEKRQVVDGGFMYNVINNYLKENILEQPELVDKLILFFGSYFDAPYEGEDLNDFFNYISKSDFTTLKGNMSEYTEEIIDKRTGKCISIAQERMRSAQEVQIANFLYLNQIEYKYERPYEYHILKSRKPYTPDFTITQGDKVAYLEHFGITEDGKNNRYNEEQLSRYKQEINDKVKLHKKHNTDLIYTFSGYSDGRSLLEHLRENLEKHGFTLIPRDSKEVFEKIVNTEENKYIMKLVKLVCTFIQNFKTNGFSIDDFSRFERKSTNERTKLFLSICQQCFLEYSKRLKEKNAVDFEDMINDSVRILNEQQRIGAELDFKYIIVDEYQDISRQRFDLTKELSKICKAKIIAVGDDWQSIYAYAGSDITLFTHFKQTMGYGLELKITKTYRNAQEVIDIAGGFIQKNHSQLRKELISPKHIDQPIIIESYSENVDRKQTAGKGGRYYMIGEKVEAIVEKILLENPKSSILLLGRYGFDAFHLCHSGKFVYNEKTGSVTPNKFPNVVLDFMTVHRAKGLGYDNVIIINARNEVYGFPSQVQDDPVLKYVVRDDHSIEYAEERRLFYVALTRTKNRVYLIVPQERPSSFVLELIDDYLQVVLHGDIDRNENKDSQEIKKCPICGYPLQLRYKQNYGLKLWMCTNEPELCDFMTNDLSGGRLSIIKCDQCRDGYLIVKPGKGDRLPFLGCTNYKHDGTGCSGFMTMDYYLRNTDARFEDIKEELR